LVTLLTATKPSTIYLCGAKTWVDGCEADATHTFVVNAEAPAFIAKVASTLGIKICFFSTDYVFDGTADRPAALGTLLLATLSTGANPEDFGGIDLPERLLATLQK